MAVTLYNPEWGVSRPIRGVLFDMDGLVLDSERLYTRFWMESAHLLGYPMTLEQALGMRSLTRETGQAKLVEYFGPGVSYPEVRGLRVKLMDAYIDEHGIAPKPGIRELLVFLKDRGIRTAIASSSPMANIQRHLAANGLLDAFDELCSGYEVPNGKPAPDMYLYAAGRLGLKPEECLALEDSPAGIESACRAGCLPVMIPDQDQPGEKLLPMLYAKADSLTDVIDLLK